MQPRIVVVAYLLFQAAATAVWWWWLWAVPESAAAFQPASWPREALLGFWLGDLLLLVGGSLAAAIFVLRGDRHAQLAIWGLAAAAWYPTLTCVGVSLLTGQAWLASALMVALAGMTLVMATIYGTQQQTPALFRAAQLSEQAALAWTVPQLAIFWSVFLGVLPAAIVELEPTVGLAPFRFAGQSVIAVGLFSAAGALGLWCAYLMATLGRGTPVPTAAASKLVIAGPYRYVRNPMAIAGISQALAVGIGLGSVAVIGYALLGGAIWHVAIRPLEEQDLHQRFGPAYRRYQQSVGLWLPRLTLTLRPAEQTQA